MSSIGEFLSGDKNAAKVEFIISREVIPNTNSEFIHLTSPDTGNELYTFWHSKKKSKGSKGQTTGGKKPYAMIMYSELEEIGLTTEQYGVITRLSKYIKWNDEVLIHSRTKKPLTQADLVNILGYGLSKLKRLLKELRELDVMYFTNKGYEINRKFIKKGGKAS